MQAENDAHTKNRVERVFIKHHQLTLQYLTDEVLKLQHTQ